MEDRNPSDDGLDLRDQDGNGLSLRIDGYQFPSKTDSNDANWLNVVVSVDTNAGSWAFVAPCLMGFEAELLGDWLDSLLHGSAPAVREAAATPDLSFIEPDLAFSTVGVINERIVLRVFFAAAGAPPWRPSERAVVTRSVFFDFDLSNDDVLSSLAMWRRACRQYPNRYDSRSRRR